MLDDPHPPPPRFSWSTVIQAALTAGLSALLTGAVNLFMDDAKERRKTKRKKKTSEEKAPS
jgi:hypothetical protein